MDNKKLEYFEVYLLEMKKECEEYLADTEEKFCVSQQEASSDLSTQPTHSADIATDSEMREENAYLISSVVNELSRISKALDKIHFKTYGKCEKCGCEIDIERLEAIPYAELCIQCGAKL